jgi:Flp pilus assembly protein TadG
MTGGPAAAVHDVDDHAGDERGVATLEFVIWIPVLVLVLALAVTGGRLAKADGEVQSAVRAAARAASQARDDPDAQAAADQAAQAALADGGVTCRSYSLSVTTAGPGGLDRAHLSCVVNLGDVDLLGAGPSKTLTADFASPVDLFRAATP